MEKKLKRGENISYILIILLIFVDVILFGNYFKKCAVVFFLM